MRASATKYQFCIRFNSVDVNSAASKAVLDCNAIFLQQGYRDFTFTVSNNSNRIWYYALLLKNMLVFFFSMKPGSVVGVQYPLLSINNVFRYFIKLAKFKNVSFFCIVHDIHSLRTGGKDAASIQQDISNLNRFDSIIVHNKEMLAWLKQNGLQPKAIILEVFDYLSSNFEVSKSDNSGKDLIAYAGNLIKSKFIYSLHKLRNCNFNLYGPGYITALASLTDSVIWKGQYSPEQISKELEGNFGLIWDGEHCESCDEIMGNYLRYNAPHKFSLYIAAGLPVIAPADSAIGNFIKANNIGYLIDSVYDLDHINVSNIDYSIMKSNVLLLRAKVITGYFFTQALLKTEAAIT
jgi:hypothetical protein